jgi:hypothetical protein
MNSQEETLKTFVMISSKISASGYIFKATAYRLCPWVKYGVRSPNIIRTPVYLLAETPQPPTPLLPHLGSYTRTLLVSQERRHLLTVPLHFPEKLIRGEIEGTVRRSIPLSSPQLLSEVEKMIKMRWVLCGLIS